MKPEDLATDLYIGRIVATARLRKGWAQRELAAVSGMGTSLLWSIELGRASLTAERRAALIRALDLQPGALDPPGFMVLSPDELRLITEARMNGQTRSRTRLLGGRLASRSTEAASC